MDGNYVSRLRQYSDLRQKAHDPTTSQSERARAAQAAETMRTALKADARAYFLGI